MTSDAEGRLKVLMVEPRGVRGINHYTYLLCNALSDCADVVMATTASFEMAERERRFRAESMFTRTRNYPVEALKLLGYVRRHRPDVVHYQMYFYWPIDLILFQLLARSGAKLFVTAHDVLPHAAKPFHYRAMAMMYRPVHCVIAHDDYCKGLLTRSLGVADEKVSVIPMGNFTVFGDEEPIGGDEARASLGIPGEAKVVLYFGVITERKGVPDLIRAFPLIRKQVPDAYLVIAGLPHNVDWDRYVALMNEMGVADRTLVLPKHLPLTDVRRVFLAADTVCLPYLGVYQSGVLQTAYAFSKPVVTTRVGGLPDAVEDGNTGFLVSPGDHEAIADAIVRILGDGQLRARMSAYISHLNDTKYSWRSIASRTLETYCRVLGRPLPDKGAAE